MEYTEYIGQIVEGKYKILELLGKGGMGSVYKARHVILGKLVAIKILHPQFAREKNYINRFCREAQAATEIMHPNIADVLDIGKLEDGTPFLIMEYLDGETVADILDRKGRVELGAACAIFEQMASAIEAAHKKGIVHRDLKPDNIFLVYSGQSYPVVKVIDFGISKFVKHDGMTTITGSNDVMGTPAYMSPEQIRGTSTVDYRSDLFSFGVIAYEMLVGRRPFAGNTPTEIIAAILTEEPPPPCSVVEDLPSEVESLLLQLLRKEPIERPEFIGTIITQLEKLQVFPKRMQMLQDCCADFVAQTVCESSLPDFDESAQAVEKKFDSSATPYEKNTSEYSVVSSWRIGDGWKKAMIGGGIFVIVVALTLAFFLLDSPSDHDVKTERTAKPAQARENIVARHINEPTLPEDIVQIEVRGVPKGAIITYDKMVIPFSTFNAKKKEYVVPLTVTARGYVPFSTSLVPSEDQVVAVKMVSIENTDTSAEQENLSSDGVSDIEKDFTAEGLVDAAKPDEAPAAMPAEFKSTKKKTMSEVDVTSNSVPQKKSSKRGRGVQSDKRSRKTITSSDGRLKLDLDL